jgi:radical SAM-linked protein
MRDAENPSVSDPESRVTSHESRIYRIQYRKTGRSAFLGSIETLDALRRALRAARLPLVYSQGFHPRARISAGPALPVGIESEAEFADAELKGEFSPEEIIARLRGLLPEGMEAIAAVLLESNAPSIDDAICAIHYEARLPNTKVDLESAVQTFNQLQQMPFSRVRGEKTVEVDLKNYVTGLAVFEGGVLSVSIQNLKPMLKISEILAGLFNIGEDALKFVRIEKVGVEWKEA